MANKIFAAIPEAGSSSGFMKAVLYSFGSWIIAWIITWLASDQAVNMFANYSIIIPLLNTILVFLKQYIDALKEPAVTPDPPQG